MLFSAFLMFCAIGQVFGDYRFPVLTAPLGRLPMPLFADFISQNKEYYDKVTSYEVWKTPLGLRKEIKAFDAIVNSDVLTMLFDAGVHSSRGLTIEKLDIRKLYDCSSCYYVKDADILAAVSSLTQADLDDISNYKIQELHDFAVAAMEKKFCFNMTLLEQKLNLSSLRVINDEWPLFVADIVAAAVKCRADILGLTQSELAERLNTNLSTLLGYNMTQIETTLLDVNANCTNKITSFNCTCPSGFTGGGVVCNDIDECIVRTHNCHVNADCTNINGSYKCECKTGYTGNGTSCEDIDECRENFDNCNINATCTNINGSYTCACEIGFSGNGVICTDNNECTLGTDDCNSTLATCSNTIGSFICACNGGYTGDGRNCTDIDECTLGTDDCHHSTLATCSNTIGSFICACNSGYTGNGRKCTDIDECEKNLDNCNVNATCTNINGSFICTCNSGYTGDGRNCTDIDECIVGTRDCHANADCTKNTIGSYKCQCKAGYTGNGTSCADIDECASNTYNCGQNAGCVNTQGSFNCACNPGYTGDGFFCNVSPTTPTEDADALGPGSSSPAISSDINNVGLFIGIVVAAMVITILVVLIVVCFLYQRSQKNKEEQGMGTTSAIKLTTTATTNTQSATENASPRTPSERTAITAIQNTVFDEDVSPTTAVPQIYEDYLEPTMYAQLDNSKRVPVDENYQSLDSGYTKLNKDHLETISQYTSLNMEGLVPDNESDHSVYEVLPD